MKTIYTYSVENGYINIRINGKGLDGRYHSMKAPYPISGVDGKRLTKKKAIECLLKDILVKYYPDGKVYNL